MGLTLAADLAMIYDEDAQAAERLLREALELDAAREAEADPAREAEADGAREAEADPLLLSRLAMALGDLDRFAEAAGVARRALTVDPSDHRLEEMRGEWLEELAELGADPTAACNCRSGRRFEECCGPEAERELEFFADRGPLEEVRVAVEAFAAAGAAAERVEDGLDEWVDEGALAVEDVEPPGGRDQPFVRLAVERSWMFPTEPGERAILAAYAVAESGRTELARRASEWGRSAIWGMWELGRRGNPGVTVTEYLTGLPLYAAIPAEQLEGLAPWTVLLGYLVPVDGVWRSGGAFYSLAPAEARALADVLLEVVEEIGGRSDLDVEVVEWAGLLRADLRSTEFLPELGGSAAEEVALVAVRSCALVVFPRLVAQLRRWRGSAPAVVNSDGEPLVLIEARLGVADPRGARAGLLAHADFEAGRDEVVWYGQDLGAAEREQTLAKVRAEGYDVDAEGRPPRYVRGGLRFKGGEIAVSVNSQSRLRTLLGVLAELGHPARVLGEKRTDVAQRINQRRRWVPAPPPLTEAPADPAGWEAWLSALPDQPLELLSGLTPRQAAGGDAEEALRLEVFLREVEHQVGLEEGARLRDGLGLVVRRR